MCILCVASRWSRRIVTMLPWLIIPLIILWALSQLLPPGFRFEVTSPRLACVGVLLVSLAWYEIVMPKLSSWRARRSALLKERRRIQAQEAAKWRKEATRRCRNCLTAYRDQTPGGGRFMCTYCGHVSKRPVLDIPAGSSASMGQGMGSVASEGGPFAGQNSTNTLVNGGISFGRSSRGMVGRGFMDRPGWGSSRGWIGSRPWPSEAGGWIVNSSWYGGSWSGGEAYLGGGGSSWRGVGGPFGGGICAVERCIAGESCSGVLSFMTKVFYYTFCCVGWIWGKVWRGGSSAEDNLNGVRKYSQKFQEDEGVLHATRIEKARRKAEEKRQARLEKEQLEAEEKRQREEVARLVEERRRQRDEKIEAEKESDREAAAERDRETRKEKEAERRRLEKARGKDKPKELDPEEVRKKKAKENEKKSETESCKRNEDTKGATVNHVDSHKGGKVLKFHGQDVGFKAIDPIAKSSLGNVTKAGSSRAAKGELYLPLKNSGVHVKNSTSFWGRNFSTGGNSAGKLTKSVIVNSPTTLNTGSNLRVAESPSSTWNRLSWTKVWGKGASSTPDETSSAQLGAMDVIGNYSDHISQNGVKYLANGLTTTAISQQSVEVSQLPAASSSQTNSWLRLFSSPAIVSSVALPFDSEIQSEKLKEGEVVVQAQMASTTFPPDCILLGSSDPIALLASESLCFQSPTVDSVSGSLATSIVTDISSSCFSAFPCHEIINNFSGLDMHDPLSLLGPVSDSLLTSIPLDLGTTRSSNMKSSPLSPIRAPVSGPISLPPATQSLPLRFVQSGEDDSNLCEHHVPQILEPWGLPPCALDDSGSNMDKGRWQMWGSPQLHEIKLPESSPWVSPPTDDLLVHDNGLLKPLPHSTLPLLFQPGSQIPSCLFSLQQNQDSPRQSSDEQLGRVPALTSNSIWSDSSAFESTLRIWEDPDIHQSVPLEFVDCITQELMRDPVITADGHTYERSAIEAWLRSHDTSPKTGEVLPPPPGGYGTDVDKTLRPNHILRGQIIEYKERLARESMLKDSVKKYGWSTSSAMGGSSAWSVISSATIPLMGGLYTTPGNQSVWSYNLS